MISLEGFALARTWNEDTMDLLNDADSISRQEDEIEIDLNLTDGTLQDVKDEDMVGDLADFHSLPSNHRDSDIQGHDNAPMEGHLSEREDFVIDHDESTEMTANQYLEDAVDQDQGEDEDVIVDDLLDETDDAAEVREGMEGGEDGGQSFGFHDDNREPPREFSTTLEQLNAESPSQAANRCTPSANLPTHDFESRRPAHTVTARLARANESSLVAERSGLPKTAQVARDSSEKSDELTAFDSNLIASEASAKSSSTTTASPQKSPVQRASPRIPIYVTYEDTEMSLFPFLHLDQEQTQTFLLEDDNLIHRPINMLLQACRSVLGDSINVDDELTFSLPEIDLHVTELSTTKIDMSLSQIVNVYIQLHSNDGKEETPPLYAELTSKPHPFSRWNLLKEAARKGKGINNLQVNDSFACDIAESHPMQKIKEPETSNADGMKSVKDEVRAHPNGQKTTFRAAATLGIQDEDVALDAVQDLTSYGNDNDFSETEPSTLASHQSPAYIEGRSTSTSTHVEAMISSSQKPHPQSNQDDVGEEEDTKDDVGEGEDTKDLGNIQNTCDSPRISLLADEGSSDQTNGLNNKPLLGGAFECMVDGDEYSAEHTSEIQNKRIKNAAASDTFANGNAEAIYSNPEESSDLDDWNEEEDQDAAAAEHGNVSSSIPLNETHEEVFTQIMQSGDDQISVHEDYTNEQEGVHDGQRPVGGPLGHMTQDHEVTPTYDGDNADEILHEEHQTPTETSRAQFSALTEIEHYENATERISAGAIGSGNIDTVNIGASTTVVQNNEAEQVTKPARIEGTKDTAPTEFLDFALSDEDGTIIGDEELPGDILDQSIPNSRPALASSLLKRPNANEDETLTGLDLPAVKRARTSQQAQE